MAAGTDRWNHNIHYHPLVLAAVPHGCGRALDVGCGEGNLARELRTSARHVTGIDLDEPSIRLARHQDPTPGLEFLHGDFLTYRFEGTFDFIASVAALHHMDASRALARMGALLRPGGTLAVVGLARSRDPADLVADTAGAVVHLAYSATRTSWEHCAPVVWPPPETYRAMRRLAVEILPGVRYRRHLLYRYSLVWTKPAVTP